MPWNPRQHRLFCARCKNGKGSAQMCKMCHEGIKDGGSSTPKKSGTDWKKERDHMR